MLSSLILQASYAQDASGADVKLAKDYSLMPKISVQSLSAGQTQVSIETQKDDGSTQVYIVLSDMQGNQEKLIKTLSPEGEESVSVVGKDENVPVLPITRLAIGDDGTLVNAESQPEKSITPSDESAAVAANLTESESEEASDAQSSELAAQADESAIDDEANDSADSVDNAPTN